MNTWVIKNNCFQKYLFEQQQTHSYVRISRPFLMKRLQTVVRRASSGGQSNPSSSCAGNPMPGIILGQILSVKHIAIFTYFFFIATMIYISSKKSTFKLRLINLLECVAFCANVIQKVWRSQEEWRVGKRILWGDWLHVIQTACNLQCTRSPLRHWEELGELSPEPPPNLLVRSMLIPGPASPIYSATWLESLVHPHATAFWCLPFNTYTHARAHYCPS